MLCIWEEEEEEEGLGRDIPNYRFQIQHTNTANSSGNLK